MLKIKLDIKKYLPFIIMFIIIFSVSAYMMLSLRKKVENNLRAFYSKKLEEIKEKPVEEVEEKVPLRSFKQLYSEELNDFLLELKQRIDLYKNKDTLLNRKEKEINSFKADLDVQKKELLSLRERLFSALLVISEERIDLNNDLLAFTENERNNLKNLSIVYASMEASKSAQIINNLDSETGAKILSGMPSKKSARILVAITPDAAVKLTNQMKKLEIIKEISGSSLKERNIKKLAVIYQDMEASKAVSILEGLDENTAISILSYMSEKKLGKILEKFDAKKASIITIKIQKKRMKIDKNKTKGA